MDLNLKVPEANMGPAALTVDEAHALIGRDKISRGSFYRAIQRGGIDSIRLGKRILIPKYSLMRLLRGAEAQ